MADCSDQILAAVADARATGQPLYLRGGDSKRHQLGRDCAAEELDLSGHRGILDYHPDELYINARAGTPLTEIAAALAERDQELPFEPPLFGGSATVGGTLAGNLSGPARPWRGSIRDAVMGLRLVNGRGEQLRFGGTVVKNVAGYDVTRLQAGALGTLGVLTEVTLKVLPRVECEITLVQESAADTALATMSRLAATPQPLAGACWVDGRLYLRLAGAAAAVRHSADTWGGERLPAEDRFWDDLRDMTLPFFSTEEPLWRFSVTSTAPLWRDLGPQLIDWGGALRWLRCQPDDRSTLDKLAAGAGGHVTLFRGGDRSGEVRPPLSNLEQRLHRQLKQAFDPDGLFNPGRLYHWM
jgi:glycolate oxidase FAD binding subunit